MAKKNYNIVVAFFTIPGGLVASLLRKPFILMLRGSDVPFHDPRFHRIDMVLQHIVPLIWKCASRVVANSEGLKEEAISIYPVDIDVIPNGVDIKKFYPSEDRDIKQILSCGRLSPVKNFDLLIDAFSIVKNEINDAKLRIIGDGPERRNLESKIAELGLKDCVDLSGAANHDEMPHIYRTSGVYVLTSHNEGMNNTLLEAIASGLPIVSTHVGGVDELIGDNGIIIEERDPDILADAIVRIITSHNYWQMCRRSREIAEGFTWERVTARLIELIETCI